MLDFFKTMFVKNYENLSGEEFKSLFKATPGAVLLDVPKKGEFQSGTI